MVSVIKIQNGSFREDLYYRLNTIPLNIPPLKERKDEILQIADDYVKNINDQYAVVEK